MLTSTYTLVALSVEQTAVRAALHSLADALHALPETPAAPPARAAGLCARLREVVESCHWRKLDKFLVPALRRTGAECDAVLETLETLEQLSQEAKGALHAAVASLECGGRGLHGNPRDQQGFKHAALRCIAALRRRLEREEDELFPLARSVVGVDAWFAIANQMMAHDAVAKERRGDTVPAALHRGVPDHVPYPGGADPGRLEAGHPDGRRRFAGLSIAH